MRKIFIFALMSVCLIGCSNDDIANDSNLENSVYNASAKKPNQNSESAYSDYAVNVTTSPDGSIWTYTITKSKPNSKNISHFIINLDNCGEASATFANIIGASVNGVLANLVPTEGQGTGCDPQNITENFVKVNLEAATSWVITIKFDKGYFATPSTSWIKAGTSCNTGSVLSPGCPMFDDPLCSFSQGFFFANGALNNGSSDFWIDGLNIGGVTYTQQQGMELWRTDRGYGGNQTLNGFFQLGAARLSGIEGEVQDQANIIDAYFTSIGNVYDYLVTENNRSFFVFPATAGDVTSKQVQAAGGIIGNYIDANHCID